MATRKEGETILLNHLEECPIFLLVLLIRIVYERMMVISSMPLKKPSELKKEEGTFLTSGRLTDVNKYKGESAAAR